MQQAWKEFIAGEWQKKSDVRSFIQKNYKPYKDNAEFLTGPTEKTKKVWDKCLELLENERQKGGVLDVNTDKVSTIIAHEPGYIAKEFEVIVGLQTEYPLKRGVIVNGGIRMAEQACQAYGYELSTTIKDIYHKHRKTHNKAVFEAYTDEMRLVRSLGIITGLPDAYGRGRIIGDYRRIALYGIDFLIKEKQNDLSILFSKDLTQEAINLREETSEQIESLQQMINMASAYGADIRRPAINAREAVQWTYFGYLAAVKEQNGAAMSLGRISTFLDIYISRDIARGILDESGAQELIDQLVIKLRLARQLRTPDYNELFAGDPLWITEVIGGMGVDGRTLVTKNSYRILHTLYNLGPAPEPNLTVLWSNNLPQPFKEYCCQVSIDTSSIQYENDDLMRPDYGDDYGIACCVSAMKLGKQMQFFGARANLAKALLLAINSGLDEKSGTHVGPLVPKMEEEVLDYDKVRSYYSVVLDWLAGVYVNTMNVIHCMHDKYAYEAGQMALHDTQVERLMAFGIAGLSVAADSLSAIKYAKVQPLRNNKGIAEDYIVTGQFPCYGNNDDRVDSLAAELCAEFIQLLRKHQTYRQAIHTLSILTITSNVMYGKKTGPTPDGRKSGQPFAPGANPMHGRDRKGALAAMASVAKINYKDCQDGISYTFSIIPKALGKSGEAQVKNLSGLLDGYARYGGHHINVNVLDRAVLQDAMQHPENYPQLTIRVSGYAVHFIKLTQEQQQEVIARTFYEII